MKRGEIAALQTHLGKVQAALTEAFEILRELKKDSQQ